MIALRLLVNLSVVPSRALPANAAMKEVASGQRIAELAGDQELYIRAGYVIPLRIIYHIYKERPRIIETVQEAPPGALMITIPELTTLSDSVRMVEELQDMQGNPVWLITRTEKND